MATKGRMREESENYFWFHENELGRGATGVVYKCQHNKTGKEFAAKVFNVQGMRRPDAVTDRELTVLRKLQECCHENIVKIIAIECEKNFGHYAIVMEYCSGGSLHHMLDKPENCFGFEENDFKRVVFDVVSGMKYLNDQGMIHRDIKPGNILKYVKDDGSSIYKLTDFGAARELNAEEQFMSVYGTEEYLHPDLYERGVLKNTKAGKTFGANVDLWSLGVTFYHVATGKLPFRPYGGVRSNRDTMYEITSQKAPGIISGYQREEDGPIEWEDKLPENTRLSQGLKELIVDVLARLLEANPEKGMQCSELFAKIEGIKAMKVIHVFSVQTGTFHTIYANPDDNFARFQELIAIQTGVSARQQDLFYNNYSFKPSSMAAASTYPNTTEQKPILVLGGDSAPFDKLFGPLELKTPKFFANVSLENLDSDVAISKVAAANIYRCLHCVRNLELSRALYLEAAENVIMLLKQKARKYLDNARAIENHCNSIVMKHQACLNGCKFEVEVMHTLGTDRDVPQEIIKELEMLEKETDSFKTNMQKLQNDMAEPLKQLRDKAHALLTDGELAVKWKNMNTEEPPLNYCGIVKRCTERVEEIMQRFLQRKLYRHRLSSQNLEDHRFERLRLEEYFAQAKDVMDVCQKRRKTLHENLQKWLEEVYSCRSNVKTKLNEVESFIEMFNAKGQSEEKWRADHMTRMTKVLNEVRAKVRQTINGPSTPSEERSGEDIDESDGGNLVQVGSEFVNDIDRRLLQLSSETKEAKLQLQKGTQTFQRFVEELMEGLNRRHFEMENGV